MCVIKVEAQFADQNFYIVDSLNLEDMTEADREILKTKLEEYHSTDNDTVRLKSLASITNSIYHRSWRDYNSVMKEYCDSLLERNEWKNSKEKLFVQITYGDVINNMGYLYNNGGDSKSGLKYYQKAYEIYKQAGYKTGMSLAMNNIGFIFDNWGDYKLASEHYHKSLAISEELGDEEGIAGSYNNIGYGHLSQENYDKALDYFQKGLEIRKRMKNAEGIAILCNNIGFTYQQQDNDEEALKYYAISYKIKDSLQEHRSMISTIINISAIFKSQSEVLLKNGQNKNATTKLDSAKTLLERGIDLAERVEYKAGEATCLASISGLYFILQDYSKAIHSGEMSYEMALDLKIPKEMKDATDILYLIYKETGNSTRALQMLEKNIEMSDIIRNDANLKSLLQTELRYEYEKQHIEDSLEHNKEIAVKDISLKQKEAENKLQQIIIYAFIICLIIVLFFSILVYRMFLQKKKINKIVVAKNTQLSQANEEILTQKEEIEAQRDQINDLFKVAVQRKEILEHQREEIDDSIRYAKRIQMAVLPSDEFASRILGEHFIVFRPKDIVSGDFYWATIVNEWLIACVADCTGHGVPGAFMSMLGVSFLNDIVRKKEVTDVAQVLNHLRTAIIDALQQKGQSGENKDGMDMSIIAISNKTRDLLFAGANNPLYIIPNDPEGFTENDKLVAGLRDEASVESKTLFEVKGDKMPVAIYERMEKYTNHKLRVNPGDMLYIFTDGMPDQFGGEKGKKFKYKAFKKLILANSGKSMSDQQKAIEYTLDKWKNHINPLDGEQFEQVDDITILGMRIKKP